MDEDSDDTLKDGVRIVTLSSWQEFHQEVAKLQRKPGYVWRGQTKDEDGGWFLQSSFDRNVKSKDHRDRATKLKRQLDNFKAAMNKCYPNVLPQDDLDIWALGQHYGLWTPLLDWTLSPYIAAYFAFSEAIDETNPEDRYRYVYALNGTLRRHLTKKKKGSQVVSSNRSVPFIDQLAYPSPRFKAQEGIFIEAFQGNDIRKYVKSFAMKRPGKLILVKFRIPSKDRENCLSELHSMKIDHTRLLLDLRNVVDSCNSELIPPGPFGIATTDK